MTAAFNGIACFELAMKKMNIMFERPLFRRKFIALLPAERSPRKIRDAVLLINKAGVMSSKKIPVCSYKSKISLSGLVVCIAFSPTITLHNVHTDWQQYKFHCLNPFHNTVHTWSSEEAKITSRSLSTARNLAFMNNADNILLSIWSHGFCHNQTSFSILVVRNHR